MKKIYILEGLDCARCAEEIRAEIEKDERVKSAGMNFMKQELTVETENSCLPDELMTTVTEVVAKHEPEVTVKERQTFKEKKYIIDGLDCAQCAEEVREAVEKSEYADSAKMNFIKKELTVTPSKIISDKELLKQVTATVTAVEPDVTVSEKENHVEKKVSYTKDIVKMISAGILFIVAFILEKTIGTEQLAPKIAILSMYLAAYVICGLEVAITSIKAIAKKNFFKHYIEKHEGEKDFNVNIKLDKAWIRRIKNDKVRKSIDEDPKMDIRVVRGTYTYNEKNKKKDREVTVETQYFTNLDEGFDIADIIDLYHHERWNVENAYDVLKNSLNIEQYNTHNPIGIINETMGKVIFYNIEQIIFIESRKRIKQNKKCKYEYIPNNKYIINLLHHNDFIVSFKMKTVDKIVETIISTGAKEKISVRKGRHYKRWNKFFKSIPKTRHRIDGRRNPPVAKGKAGFVTTNH